MKLAEGGFYGDPAIFWAIAGVAAVIVMGLVAGWAPFGAARSRRSIVYSFQDRPRKTSEGYKVEIRLNVRGSTDIRSDDFDDGRPLVIDTGAQIIKLVSIESGYGPRLRALRCEVEGSNIRIGPNLIKCRQTLIVKLIVSNASLKISAEDVAIADVDVLPRDVSVAATWAYAAYFAFCGGVFYGMWKIIGPDVSVILTFAFLSGTPLITALLDERRRKLSRGTPS